MTQTPIDAEPDPVAAPPASEPAEALPIAAAGPVTQTDRIESIDVLRGFALLGILVMNIQAFAMISAAYANPSIYGDLEGVNYLVWLLSHLFTDLKMMAIFSMLFGAGVILMTERAASRGRPTAGLHYRRMGILLLFGLAHAWLFWYGDILYYYALCGMIVYMARRRRPITLFIIAVILISIGSAIPILTGLSVPYWPDDQMDGFMKFVAPPAAAIREDLAAHRGGWLDLRAHQAPMIIMMETQGFLFFAMWRICGLMLTGMALYKLGVFSAKRSDRFYRWMMIIGFGLGLPIVAFGVWRHEAREWDVIHSMFFASQFNYWGSFLVAGGWIGLVMLICRSGALPRLRARFAAVGQMALTNYLMQTIICTTIFDGYGLGAFGKVQRIGQIAIVLAVWVFQLWYSPLWLEQYRFGPFEWLWRTMTYGRTQPMRRQ